jgi:hypothetical protein
MLRQQCRRPPASFTAHARPASMRSAGPRRPSPPAPPLHRGSKKPPRRFLHSVASLANRPSLLLLTLMPPSRLRPTHPRARLLHTATALTDDSSSSSEPIESNAIAVDAAQASEDARSRGVPALTQVETDVRFAKHLNDLFEPLCFPPELARRLLTHGSHKEAARGHNARFSFIGELTIFFRLLHC